MIHTLTRMYSDLLIKHNLISEGDREIHEYGFTALFLFICNYGILFLLAALTGTIIETILFLLMYSLPRNIIGGWHARSPLLCTLYGIAMWGIVILLFRYLHIPKMPLAIFTLVSSGTLAYLIRRAEISDKRKRLGLIILALLLFIAALSIMSVIDSSYSYLILYSLLCNIIMNILIYCS